MINLGRIYRKSEDIVERRIGSKVVLIPVASGIVDLEKNILVSLNKIGGDIWHKIDGKRKISDIVDELHKKYNVEKDKVDQDILCFLNELVEKKFIFEFSGI